MKRIVKLLNSCWAWLCRIFQRTHGVVRRYVSPAFVVMLAVSFTLWYISKLTYTYTTDFNIKVEIDGQTLVLPCVVEGKGANLVSYSLSSRRIKVPLSDLRYEWVDVPTEDGDEVSVSRKIRIDRNSLRDAISLHFSDINVKSVANDADIYLD